MQRLYKAFIYSLQGIVSAFKSEPAFRQELVLAIILIPIALFIEVSVIERLLLIGSLFLVLIIELVNSAIEAVVDRISKEKHELSKMAKDTGSAAVLLSIMNAVIVWLVVLLH